MNPEDPTSRTSGLMDALHTMPLFRQVVRMEAVVGWPVPARHRPAWDGRTAVYLKLPLCSYRRPERPGDPARLFPPSAMITLNWANGAPVEYVDLCYSRPWPMNPQLGTIGDFPHDAVKHLSTAEYMAARARLLELYDRLFESLADGPEFTGKTEFIELLATLMEPSLLPYYRALGPKFFATFLGPGPSAAHTVA